MKDRISIPELRESLSVDHPGWYGGMNREDVTALIDTVEAARSYIREAPRADRSGVDAAAAKLMQALEQFDFGAP